MSKIQKIIENEQRNHFKIHKKSTTIVKFISKIRKILEKIEKMN